MGTKKRFWVDYLACLIFGAVIVPLWYYGRWPNTYCTTGFLLAVTLFASVHVVCFWILGLFVKRKGVRLFLLYLFWGFGWFLCPVLIKLSPHFLVLFPVLHAYRWWCFSGFSLLGAVFLIFVVQRCSGSSRLLRAVSVFVYIWFVILAFFAWRNISSVVPYVPKSVRSGVNYPNIYHILLDAHASQEGMEQLGGDLKPFYRQLEQIGFVTYPESKSVFTRTQPSVFSMWHMDAECHVRDGLHNNLMWRTLSTNGYRIRQYTSRPSFYPAYFTYHEARLDFQVMIIGTIWFHTFLGNNRWLSEGLRKSHRFVLRNLECAKEIYGACGNFFYWHILSPHGPFVYSSDVNTQGLIDGDWPDVNVSRHLMFREHDAIDDLVLKTIEEILKQYKGESVKPIIVLHSDHGSVRMEDKIGSSPYITEETVYGNLLAIYMPEEWKKDAKDLKFINLYRFIFNHLFGTNYEYLTDVRKNIDGSIFKEKTLPSSEP